jgi:uncharacterized membrane protein
MAALNLGAAATVFFIAASPIAELRVAIPLGVGAFGMSVWSASAISVIGNLLPILAVYGVGELWIRWTRGQQGILRRLTDDFLLRSQRRFAADYAKYGMIALPIFVGIPLPMTGAWTGAAAAFLLGIPFRHAFPLIALGVVIAAAIVASLTAGTVIVF